MSLDKVEDKKYARGSFTTLNAEEKSHKMQKKASQDLQAECLRQQIEEKREMRRQQSQKELNRLEHNGLIGRKDSKGSDRHSESSEYMTPRGCVKSRRKHRAIIDVSKCKNTSQMDTDEKDVKGGQFRNFISSEVSSILKEENKCPL